MKSDPKSLNSDFSGETYVFSISDLKGFALKGVPIPIHWGCKNGTIYYHSQF